MPAEMTQTLPKGQAWSSMGVSRLKSNQVNNGLTEPYAAEDAYLVVLQLRPFADQTLWSDGKLAPHVPFKTGSLAIYDLNRLWIADLRDKYDCLHFHIRRDQLEPISDELTGQSSTTLELPPHETVQDPAVHQIGHLLLPALARPQEASPLFIDHLTLALRAHLMHRYGQRPILAQRARGKLLAWQERRAKDLLLSDRAQDLSLEALAKACGLSRGYFIMAFRETTGLTPHQWLIAQRIAKAKELMMATEMPLAEIALTCGFADQSHFSRLFGRATGVAPRMWRSSFKSCE